MHSFYLLRGMASRNLSERRDSEHMQSSFLFASHQLRTLDSEVLIYRAFVWGEWVTGTYCRNHCHVCGSKPSMLWCLRALSGGIIWGWILLHWMSCYPQLCWFQLNSGRVKGHKVMPFEQTLVTDSSYLAGSRSN